MAGNENALLTLSGFFRDHLVWILGLIPFAFVALKLLWVSHGDLEIIAFLLKDLDIVSLVLSTITPLLPIAAVWAYLYWLDWYGFLSVNERDNLPNWARPDQNGPGANILGVALLMPISLISLAVIVIFYTWHLRSRRRTYRKRMLRFGADIPGLGAPIRLSPLTYILNVLLSSVMYVGVNWLPAEIITIDNAKPAVATVLSSDRDWTTYMQPNRQLKIVSTKDVKSRQPCSGKASVWTAPIFFVITRSLDDPNPPCAQ
ncbi:hypothetical protein [Mycobacterium sp. 1245805.9]|uniref:hypothetical protein n=1 Tax=Mycobacterium sp. 1245805.9 TaxID=1856862 RepID=UPI0012E9B066|nr:hypothetical protein [Mycobacterium sp. 1245805.9]